MILPSLMVSLVAVKGQKVFELCFELIVDVLCGSVDACRPVNSKKKKKDIYIYIESSFPLDSLRVGQKPHAMFFSHLIEVVPSINMFLE